MGTVPSIDFPKLVELDKRLYALVTEAARIYYASAIQSLIRQAVRKLPGRDPLRAELKDLNDPAKLKMLSDRGLITAADIRESMQPFLGSVDSFVLAQQQQSGLRLFAQAGFGVSAYEYLVTMLEGRIGRASVATSIPDAVGRLVLESVAGGSGVQAPAVIGFAGAAIHNAPAQQAVVPPSMVDPEHLHETATQVTSPVSLGPRGQTVYRWIHGLYRTPEQPDDDHLNLDGTDHDSPKPVDGFFPGDHPSCSCGWVPITVIAPSSL